MNPEHRWIVITGGSTGIGFAIARALLPTARRITLVADGREKLAKAAAALAGKTTCLVDTEACDFRDSAAVDALGERLLADGGPDILINNAGFAVYRAFEESTAKEIDDLLTVNFTSHVRLTKALLAPMIARRRGAISFMSSIGGRLPITPNAMYCGAKHGTAALAATLRVELARFGVEVTAVLPGRVDTPFFDHPTFQTRTGGIELKGMIAAEAVAAATIVSIRKNRALTYVPATLRAIDWMFNALPFLIYPIYDRIVRRRMDDLYAGRDSLT